MHEYAEHDYEKMAVRAMEKMFINSQAGEPYRRVYEDLERRKMEISNGYRDLWGKAKPAFMHFLKEHGGHE